VIDMTHSDLSALDNIHHIAVEVDDVSQTLQWYKREFQCEIRYHDETWGLLQFGNVQLALVSRGQHPPHVGFVSGAALRYPDLKKHRDGTRSVYVRDPSGNSVELLDPGSIACPAAP
jgi:catechol 2,3-dioxygenase-like lactoylglutathione lyase family enzyme